jgi:hypothetical protein
VPFKKFTSGTGCHVKNGIPSHEVPIRTLPFVGVLRCVRLVYYWVAGFNVYFLRIRFGIRIRELNVPAIFTEKGFLQIRAKLFLQIRAFTDKGLKLFTDKVL